jgi:hypothetical protein
MIDVSTWERRKRQITDEKEKVAVNKGKRESIISRMEKEFKVDNVQDAKTKKDEFITQRDKVEKKIEVFAEDLEAYDWR